MTTSNENPYTLTCFDFPFGFCEFMFHSVQLFSNFMAICVSCKILYSILVNLCNFHYRNDFTSN